MSAVPEARIALRGARRSRTAALSGRRFSAACLSADGVAALQFCVRAFHITTHVGVYAMISCLHFVYKIHYTCIYVHISAHMKRVYTAAVPCVVYGRFARCTTFWRLDGINTASDQAAAIDSTAVRVGSGHPQASAAAGGWWPVRLNEPCKWPLCARFAHSLGMSAHLAVYGCPVYLPCTCKSVQSTRLYSSMARSCKGSHACPLACLSCSFSECKTLTYERAL